MSDKNEKMNPYEIAVIGYTQAGKTVLGVGLYATASAEFAVTGKDEETVNYLIQRKAILESGEWADPTNESEMLNLQLIVSRRGMKPVEVDFKEYMGERASINPETYKRDVIGNPRAAMILLNPKMEILRDAGRRNEMIGQIKDIISYLSGPGMRCGHIAFVITAADLLTTSLKDYKEEFEGYKEEITNCLNTNPKFQNAWKEFEVTVTGPLEDPEHPRIARAEGNTSRKPFEWLIEQIDNVGTKGRLAKLGHCIVTLLILGCIAFSSWYFYFDCAAVRALDGVLTNHRGDNVEGKEKALRALENRVPFFERNRKSYDEKKNEVEVLIDNERLGGFSQRMNSLSREISELDSQDGIDDNGYESKKKEVEELGRELNEYQAKTDANKSQLRSLQGKWKTKKDEIIKKLDAWRQRYEDKQFADGRQKVITDPTNATLDLNDGTNINAALGKCNEYEKWAKTEDAKPEIDFKTREEAWKEIKHAKDTLLNKLLTNQIERVKSDGAEQPCVSVEDMDFLQQALRKDGALSEKEYKDWMNKLNAAVADKYKEWVKVQGEKCDGFIKKIKDCTVADTALEHFRNCCRDCPCAPSLRKVAKAASDVVIKEFEKIYKDTEAYQKEDNGARYNPQQMHSRSENMRKTYGQLKTLANKVLKVGDSAFKETDAYKFAEDCQNKGIVSSNGKDFQQEYKIKKIEVKIDYDNSEGWTGDFPKNFNCVRFEVSGVMFDRVTGSFKFDSFGKCEELKIEDNRQWRKIWSGDAKIKGSPWEDVFLAVGVTESNKVTWEKTAELLRLKLQCGENTKPTYEEKVEFNTGRMSGDSTPDVHIKIYLEGSGTDFFSFARPYLFKGGK